MSFRVGAAILFENVDEAPALDRIFRSRQRDRSVQDRVSIGVEN